MPNEADSASTYLLNVFDNLAFKGKLEKDLVGCTQ